VKTLSRAQDAAEMRQRLSRIQPASTRRWGRMSSHQMICHLLDGFRMMTGDKAVIPTSTLFQRTVLKWIVLYVPAQWPVGVATSPELDQQIDGTKPGDFERDRGNLEACIGRVTAQLERTEWQTHPIFGRMTTAQWMRWAYLHVDHHLRQFGL
jgi:hypothetical protein